MSPPITVEEWLQRVRLYLAEHPLPEMPAHIALQHMASSFLRGKWLEWREWPRFPVRDVAWVLVDRVEIFPKHNQMVYIRTYCYIERVMPAGADSSSYRVSGTPQTAYCFSLHVTNQMPEVVKDESWIAMLSLMQ